MPTSALCCGVPAPAPWGLDRTGGHKGRPYRNTGRPKRIGATLVVARPAGCPPAVAVYPGMNRESGGEHMKIIVDAMGGDNAPVSNVRGALAAELPPTFHPEALKAQAVCARTYAVRRIEAQKNKNSFCQQCLSFPLNQPVIPRAVPVRNSVITAIYALGSVGISR